MDIKTLISQIHENATFEMGLDGDNQLIVFDAGGGLPRITAWDKNGYYKHAYGDIDDYAPITRAYFMETVINKPPLD